MPVIFKYILMKPLNLYLYNTGNRPACMRTLCDSVFIGNTTVETYHHSNTKIMGCNFNHLAPVTSHQVLQSNYTLGQDLLPTPTGMNLIMVRKQFQHDDPSQLIKWVQNNRQKTLTTIHRDAERIQCIVERVKKNGEHHWWETLFGWSPMATGILNLMLHAIVVSLLLTFLRLLLIIILYTNVWQKMKQIISI